MREVTQDDLRIRQFVLGELRGVEREELEDLFLTDATFRERVLRAEDDLIDDYLDGELKGSDLEEFRIAFQSTPHHAVKLRAARSIHNYAKREFAVSGSRAVKRSNLFVYIAVAATVLVGAMAALWLFNRTRESQLTAEERSRHMAVERQLTEANARLTGIPAIVSLVLAPVTTRSSSSQPRLSFGTGAENFDLWLVPATTQYENFRASLKRENSSEPFLIPGLRLESRPEGKGVRLRLPARLLAHGQYEVALQAIGPGGQLVDAGTFTFQVTD